MSFATRLAFVCLVPSLTVHCMWVGDAELSEEELEVMMAGDVDWIDPEDAGDPGAGDSDEAPGDEPCTPPEPVAVRPEPHAIGVDVGATLEVSFDELIAPGSVTVDSFFLDGGVTGLVMVTDETVILQPGEPLAYDTTYSATVTEAVTDLGGCPLIGDLTWSFTTEPQPIDPALILNILFRQDVIGDSGIWFSSQGDPSDLPTLNVTFTDVEGQQTRTYRYGAEANAFAFYIRQAGFEDGGCEARGTNGSGRQCHKKELLIKESSRRRGIFLADLSDIPASADIDSCSLTLHLHEGEGLAYGDHSSVVGVYELLTEWDWDTATWTVPWNTAGGDIGSKILNLRAHEDMHARGWNKANPTGSIDLTDHVRALQAAR